MIGRPDVGFFGWNFPDQLVEFFSSTRSSHQPFSLSIGPLPPPVQTILLPPKTIDQAVDYLLNVLSPEEIEFILDTPKGDLDSFHFPWECASGTHSVLWDDNTELLLSCGSPHPDDASMVLLKTLRERCVTRRSLWGSRSCD